MLRHVRGLKHIHEILGQTYILVSSPFKRNDSNQGVHDHGYYMELAEKYKLFWHIFSHHDAKLSVIFC